jgi:hypothetical protein
MFRFLQIRHAARPASAGRQRSNRFESSAGFEPLECRTLLAVDVVPTFSVTEDWGSGFQAQLKLQSRQAAAITPWRLEFDMAAGISSIWDAKIESHVGQHYVIVGSTWNNTLPGNGSIAFGFVAAPGGSPVAPKNYILNGSALGGSTPVPTLPTLSIGDAAVTEGQGATTNALFTVKLSAAATTPVSVAYRTVNGTALAGNDFTATSGTLQFSAGQTSKVVTVAVLGDTTVESDETFTVELLTPTGATLAQSKAAGTIRNDDVAPPQPTGDVAFRVVSDWGSGFTGEVTVNNRGTKPLTDWRLEFDFAGTINSIWNATVFSRSGNHYILQGADYNRTIPVGGSITLGFVASPGGGVVPTNFVLPGGGPNPVNRAPAAVNDAVFTTIGQQVLVDVLANDTDPDGDAISLLAVGKAAHGTVAMQGNAVRYTPAAGYTGADSFTYQVRDARGATAIATVNVTVSQVVANAEQMFAPYVDMTLWPTYDLVSAARDQHIKFFTLAFVVADPQGKPAWGGYSEYALGTEFDTKMRAQIAAVRALGGDVVVSFGGASNQELAEVITSATALQAAYQSIIDAYGLTQIDFDIEGGALAQRASVDRRNVAIAGLQQAAAAAGRKLEVSYTLPVLPTGLTPDGTYLLQSAVQRGVNVDVVNVMAMDYGDSAAPNPQGRMGDYAIQAATSLFNQLKTVYGSAKTDAQLWAMVGITPMIGLNDVTTEVFDQQEAREVLAFAEQHGIGRLSFWSLNRDKQNSAGRLNYVDLMSSSILQSPFEFSQIFGAFDD